MEEESEGILKCPNCGKEAINVNGKFVCLDCGVELNPSDTSTNSQPTQSESVVTNHGEIPGDELQTLPESKVDPTLPNIPQPTVPQPAPVETEYLNELKTDNLKTGGSYDFEQPSSSSPPAPAPTPVPEPPVIVQETPTTREIPKPETYFQPEVIDITPKKSDDPVSDSLSTSSVIGMGEPLVGGLEGTEAAKEKAQELFIGEVLKEEIPVTPMPVPDTTSMQAEEVFTPTIEQPSTDANIDDLLNKYSASSMNGDTPPITMPIASPAFDSVQPVTQSYPNEAVPTNPYQPVQSQTNQMPGATNLPSAESVFGPQPGDLPERLNVNDSPVNKKKKIIIILIASIAAVLFLVGLVFLGMSFTKPKNVKTTEQKQQDETFQISEEVSSAMDAPLNMVASFDQSIDFSKATVNTIEGADVNNTDVLKLLFENPVTTKGSWQTNAAGDISLEETYNNLNIKMTYLESEKSTYNYSTETTSWSKIDGDQIQDVPAFYPPRVKAALFYNTKVNSITETGQEDIEGNTYRKMKIIPKTDIVENVLTGSNTALSKTVYSSVNLDNLEIFAWVTSSGQIYKISITGDMGVESDLYSGTITINSTIIYKYQDVKIEKPELPAS